MPSDCLTREARRGGAPSKIILPRSFEGEGDTGSEVDKQPLSHSINSYLIPFSLCFRLVLSDTNQASYPDKNEHGYCVKD